MLACAAAPQVTVAELGNKRRLTVGKFKARGEGGGRAGGGRSPFRFETLTWSDRSCLHFVSADGLPPPLSLPPLRQGKALIHVREYYEKEGKLMPGFKGITLSPEAWAALRAKLPEVLRAAEEIGGEGGGGGAAAAAAEGGEDEDE